MSDVWCGGVGGAGGGRGGGWGVVTGGFLLFLISLLPVEYSCGDREMEKHSCHDTSTSSYPQTAQCTNGPSSSYPQTAQCTDVPDTCSNVKTKPVWPVAVTGFSPAAGPDTVSLTCHSCWLSVVPAAAGAVSVMM